MALVSCRETGTETPLAPAGGKVRISLKLAIPDDGLPTRAGLANDPYIDHICVAVFGGSGFFNEWLVADIDKAEKNYDSSDPMTVYSISFYMTMSESRLRLHFIANGPTDAPLTGITSKDNEEGMMARLRTSLGDSCQDGYWQKVVLPLGVRARMKENSVTHEYEYVTEGDEYLPSQETLDQFPSPIMMLRNFARIKITLPSTGSTIDEITHIALAYAPAAGTFAPMMESAISTDAAGNYLDTSGDFYPELFVPGYQDISFAALGEAPYNYGGYFPSDIVLGGYYDSASDDYSRYYPSSTSEMTAWNAAGDNWLFAYERTAPASDRPATRVIIRAHHQSAAAGTYKYYRLDLKASGVSYPLLRNSTYELIVGSVDSNAGRDTAQAAADYTSDVSSEKTDLAEVSDGTSSIAVEYIQKTYVEGSKTYTLDFQFDANESDSSFDNGSVSIETGIGVGASFEKDATSSNGAVFASTPSVTSTSISGKENWGRIQYTTTNNNQRKYQTIRVKGDKGDGTYIYRDVVIYLMPMQNLSVECIPRYLEDGLNKSETVRVYIPADLTRSMFPMDFTVEAAAYSLNPYGVNMPAQYGPSIVPGQSSNSFYFIRTLTWEDYEGLPASGLNKYFDCPFITIKSASACKVYVKSDYFNYYPAADATVPSWSEFFNYKQRFFTRTAGTSGPELGGGEEATFTFYMDAATSSSTWYWDDNTSATSNDKVIPRVVTITLEGIQPATEDDGYGNEVLVDRNYLTMVEGVYIWTVPGDATPVSDQIELHLQAGTADTYSITLSTSGSDNPDIYADYTVTGSITKSKLSNIGFTDTGGSAITQVIALAGRAVQFRFTYGGDLVPVTFKLTGLQTTDSRVSGPDASGVYTFTPNGTAKAQVINFTTTDDSTTAALTDLTVTDSENYSQPSPNAFSLSRFTYSLSLPETATVSVGSTVTLTPTITPSHEAAITWSSSAPGVATVSGGVVSGVAVGNATITATAVIEGMTVSGTCEVSVRNMTLKTGTATFSGSNFSSTSLTYTSGPIKVSFSYIYQIWSTCVEVDQGKSSTLTVTPVSSATMQDVTITGITLTFYSGYSNTYNPNSITGTGWSYTNSSTTATYTGSSTEAVTAILAARSNREFDLRTITVTYSYYE